MSREKVEQIDDLYYELERLDRQVTRTEEEIILRLDNIMNYPQRIQNVISQKQVIRLELEELERR